MTHFGKVQFSQQLSYIYCQLRSRQAEYRVCRALTSTLMDELAQAATLYLEDG